jgi:hypothetical protein
MRSLVIVVSCLCGLGGWSAHAQAGVYKCLLPDGSITYQEEACPAGRELRDFDKDPPTLSVVPFGKNPGPDSHATIQAPPKAKSEPKGKKPVAPTADATKRKFLAPGINEGEVVARIGEPDMTSGGKGRKTSRWTYMPVPDDPGTITTLTFEYGRLVEVERRVVK